MRLRFIKLLLLLVAAAITSDLIRSDPGYVLIEYRTWMIETSLATLVLLSLTAMLLIFVTKRLIRPVITLAKRNPKKTELNS